ncbi:MAG TPA: FAD-dependent monooxygenase, partial [Xanthobacteraceae bacterium]|nr:FAD-dependent monooxygenase [Xanthobacteraceae bacterium]
MVQTNTSVAIIGGGIGGLAAAVSLLQAGFDVHVYEQVRAPREVGAGIVLTPNATRLLYRLGFRAKLETLGVAPLAWRQRRWDDGSTLMFTPVAASPGEPATFYTSHRADVLSMLIESLPTERLHLAHRLAGFTDWGDCVEMQFGNGAQTEAGMVIGADGIHSTVRGLLFGAERPRFTGCVAYRGLVPAGHLSGLDLPTESQLWLGPGKHFVHYPVQDARLVNFVCLIERDTWTKESWIEPGDVADALAAYAGWHAQVRSIISAVNETFVWGLFDRPPLLRWSVGRVTLLGNACHPMLPFMAQGAAQAIEDAATLAAVLAQSAADVPQALRRYESLRLPRTARIQTIAASNKMRNHLPDGPQQRERDARMASGAADWSIGASTWIYEHDAVAAAETGSLGLPPDAD